MLLLLALITLMLCGLYGSRETVLLCLLKSRGGSVGDSGFLLLLLLLVDATLAWLVLAEAVELLGLLGVVELRRGLLLCIREASEEELRECVFLCELEGEPSTDTDLWWCLRKVLGASVEERGGETLEAILVALVV
jgi:hypothetical protein